MSVLPLISDFMTLAFFCTLLFLFCYVIHRFITYVKTLHFIEYVQDDILDSNFEVIQGIEVETKAAYCPKCRRVHKPKIKKPNLDKPSDVPREQL